jgi:hypothetical protein
MWGWVVGWKESTSMGGVVLAGCLDIDWISGTQ